ncbi:MAG: DDE-type integrase/transposase/recombinase [Thermoplasmata archaeon]
MDCRGDTPRPPRAEWGAADRSPRAYPVVRNGTLLVTPEIAEKNPGAGDAWLWAAIDADTKLVPCWLIARRDPVAARDFIEDLAGRLSNRIQLTSDGLKLYVKAVDKAFAGDIDFAQLASFCRETRKLLMR